MKLDIQIQGIEQLKADFQRYGKEADKAIKRGVDRTAIAIESDAKLRLEGSLGGLRRILTGRLRASVHAELGTTENDKSNTFQATPESKDDDGSLGVTIAKDEAVVGTNVEYAGAIEYGTKHITGMSFLGFASVRQQTELPRRITEELNKLNR